MNHQFVQLPRVYPQVIKEWAGSFLLSDKELRSERHQRMLKILTHRDVITALKRVFPKLERSLAWPSNFTTFIESVAEVPDRRPDRFYTPKQISDELRSLADRADQLIQEISERSAVLLVPNLDSVIRELAAFKKDIELQLCSSEDKSVGPTFGREDGTKALVNWCARQVGILAMRHLSELHPTFSAAVVRALLDLRFGMTESNMRDLFKI